MIRNKYLTTFRTWTALLYGDLSYDQLRFYETDLYGHHISVRNVKDQGRHARTRYRRKRYIKIFDIVRRVDRTLCDKERPQRRYVITFVYFVSYCITGWTDKSPYRIAARYPIDSRNAAVDERSSRVPGRRYRFTKTFRGQLLFRAVKSAGARKIQ